MLSRFFIDRPIFAAVISIVIVLAGLMSGTGWLLAQVPGLDPKAIEDRIRDHERSGDFGAGFVELARSVDLPVIASGPLISFVHFLRSKLAMWPDESTVHTTPSVVRSRPRDP